MQTIYGDTKYYPSTQEIGKFIPVDLIVTGHPIMTRAKMLAPTDTDLPLGAILGVDNTGKYKLAKASVTDGSQIPCGILAERVSASTQEQAIVVYKSGEFNKEGTHLDASFTDKEAVVEKLEERQIFLSRSIVNRTEIPID